MDPKFAERLTYALIAIGGALVGYFYSTKNAAPAQGQPSVPSVIAPSCPGPGCQGSCNPDKRRHNPFRVSCPNCRRVLNVQEPETGDVAPVGDVVGETSSITIK